MVGLLAAFRAEIGGVLSDLSPYRTSRQAELTFYQGKFRGGEDVVLATCGPGAERGRVGAKELIYQFTPSLIVSTGTCGAVSDSLETGHIVVPETIQFLSLEQEDPLPHPAVEVAVEIQESLALARARAGLQGQNGLLLTSDRIVRTVAEKKAITEIPRAFAVDMESVAVAEEAERMLVPFGTARAVLDRAWDEVVVDYDSMLKGRAEPSPGDIATYLFTHPGQWGSFYRDAKRLFRAAASLRAYFRAFFEQRSLYV